MKHPGINSMKKKMLLSVWVHVLGGRANMGSSCCLAATVMVEEKGGVGWSQSGTLNSPPMLRSSIGYVR